MKLFCLIFHTEYHREYWLRAITADDKDAEWGTNVSILVKTCNKCQRVVKI